MCFGACCEVYRLDEAERWILRIGNLPSDLLGEEVGGSPMVVGLVGEGVSGGQGGGAESVGGLGAGLVANRLDSVSRVIGLMMLDTSPG